jgi:hypothetical protein
MSTKDGLRERADGMTAERQKKLLTWLARTGCVKDACGKAGISTTSFYRACKRLPGFAAKAARARAMAATELEAIAFQRATEGAEETVIRNGKVAWVRKKPSDAMLRTLLQGSNPAKYRAGGGGDSAALRAQIEKELRPKIEAEMRAKIKAEQKPLLTGRALGEEIDRRLSELNRRMGGKG